MMKANFWKEKKVLITGHTGFKGSWLSLWLQSRGAHLIGYSLAPPTKPSLFEVAHVVDGMTSILGDIRDLEFLQAVVAEHEPEIIIHLAAQPLVQHSYKNPVDTYSTNVIGTVNVLEVVRHSESVRVLVCITSDKCYENEGGLWGIRENEPLGGCDPYSNSKACAELVIAAYRASYFLAEEYMSHGVAVASARAGNVIGGGDWAADRLIPDVIRALMANRNPSIRNPNAIRPWQHVLEAIGGYMDLVEKLWVDGSKFAEGWNFGPNDEDCRTVSWITDYLMEFWGADTRWEPYSGYYPYEAACLRLDCSKAKSRLRWKPKLDIFTSLSWTAKWYRSYQRGFDMHEFTEKQILHYENYKRVSTQIASQRRQLYNQLSCM